MSSSPPLGLICLPCCRLLQAYKPLCTTSERNMSVQWGKLAADTLTQNYDGATEDLLRLREALDNQSFSTPLMQLQQRTWLMHWSLHVFWNTENGKNALIDMFLQPAYLSAIQINAQHLLRYLSAAVVVSRKRRNVLRELIKVIQQESYEYSDPITQVGTRNGGQGLFSRLCMREWECWVCGCVFVSVCVCMVCLCV